MTDEKPKKVIPPGLKPFKKGQIGNPKGINRYTKTIACADDMFLEEFFKEVDALQGGQVVKATQHKLGGAASQT